tara:strand:+ start:1972 stop:2889 length:918 start_codon:yes stop_codon:yes gene_type:complete
MRTAFIDALLDEARQDPSIMLLTGDLGFNVLEEFAEELPAQFLNCGVAEQSMIGVAAGLAASGRQVFVYSIANFPTFRCLEQIRNDVAYHGHNVTIVSVGAGFAYGSLGYSHLGLEDLAIMRAIPGIDVICPSDPIETDLITRMLIRKNGPAYLRLGKAGEEILHVETPQFSWGDAISLRSGSDLTIAASGSVLSLALEAHDCLADMGIDVEVLSVPFLRPLSPACLEASIGRGLVTVEEHSIIGGFGSAVLDAVIACGEVPHQRTIGSPAALPAAIGDSGFMRQSASLTTEAVIEAVQSLLKHP